MPTNDFLPIATSAGANVETQAAFAADTATLTNGFTSGLASSLKFNKVWRQSSIMSSVIAQYINSITGANTADDGTTATLLANFAQSVRLPAYAIDTSATVNVLAAALSPAPAALVAGMEIELKPAITNTGAATLNLNGLGAYPLINYSGALVGGELVAGQHYKVSWKASASSWLVMTGAASTTRMVQSATVTASGTSVRFTSIPSWAKRLTLSVVALSTNGTSNITVRIGTGGTPSATGYTSDVVVLSNGVSPSEAVVNTGFQLSFDNTAAATRNATLVLYNMGGNLWQGGGIGNISGAISVFNGAKTLSGVLDMISATSTNGTDVFDGGSISAMWEG